MNRALRYESVYHLLDHLRARPALFLGNWYLRHPFTALMSYLAGLRFSTLAPGSPSFWGFSQWITAHASLSTNLPWDDLEERLGEEQAFVDYFRYLDEYRGCREVTVAGPSEPQVTPRIYLLDEQGNKMAHPVPDAIFA